MYKCLNNKKNIRKFINYIFTYDELINSINCNHNEHINKNKNRLIKYIIYSFLKNKNNYIYICTCKNKNSLCTYIINILCNYIYNNIYNYAIINNTKTISINNIGSGTYGTIYNSINNKFVIKSFNDSDVSKIECYLNSIRELIFLQKLKTCKNIVHLFGYNINNFDIKIYLQKFNSPLNKNKNNINTTNLKSIIYEIINGYIEMNNNMVFHNDIKTNNILFNSDTNISLCDFSISTFNNINENKYKLLYPYIQTVTYSAPEILLKKLLSNKRNITLNKKLIDDINDLKIDFDKTDIWSLGIVFLDLIHKTIPDHKTIYNENQPLSPNVNALVLCKYLGFLNTELTNNNSSLINIYSNFLQLNNKYINTKYTNLNKYFTCLDNDPIFHDFIKKIICIDYKNRLSLKDILQHEYFNDFHKLYNTKILDKYEMLNFNKISIYYNNSCFIKLFSNLISNSFKNIYNKINNDSDISYFNIYYLIIYILNIKDCNINSNIYNFSLFCISCCILIDNMNIHGIQINKYLNSFNYIFDEKEIVNMINYILKLTNCKICFTTSYDYLIYYINKYNLNTHQKVLTDKLNNLLIDNINVFYYDCDIIAQFIISSVYSIDIDIINKYTFLEKYSYILL